MHFVPTDQCGKYSSTNQLWGKEREFGRSVSGLVMSKQGGHPWVISKAYGDQRCFAGDVFQNTKAEAAPLTLAVSQECRAQV